MTEEQAIRLKKAQEERNGVAGKAPEEVKVTDHDEDDEDDEIEPISKSLANSLGEVNKDSKDYVVNGNRLKKG